MGEEEGQERRVDNLHALLLSVTTRLVDLFYVCQKYVQALGRALELHKRKGERYRESINLHCISISTNYRPT